MHGSYSPYLVKDPTADERVEVAGRVYRAVLDEWVRRAGTPPRPGGWAADVEARSRLELVERLGPWSLRWQEAQDNAAKSRAARYQSLSNHLARMSDLEHGRFGHESDRAKAAGAPLEPRADDIPAEAARFFRPIDGWSLDQVVPTHLQSGRPLNPVGVGVTPAEQAEMAARVYRAVLDETVARWLASPREGEPRREAEPQFDALLAERLGFWSDLWGRSQDAESRDTASRPLAARGGSARVSLAGARSPGPLGRTAAIQAHIERMSELEHGHFLDGVLKRAGRPTSQPIEMKRFPEFAQVARFFRVEAETRLTGAPTPKKSDTTDSSQVETAGRMYRAILDGAAHRYREAPRADAVPPDVHLIFDPGLAERLAAWSARWARALIRTDWSRLSSFTAVRSHVERMASLEDGRSLRDALERAGLHTGALAPLATPREFADVARFFRLEAFWELEQLRSR
jgi:hypothetical protein